MLSQNRWNQISELFDAVADLAPDRQRAYLDEHCPDDEMMRDEIQALLRSDQESDSLLDGSAGALAGTAIQADLSGTNIGPWHLERLLGAGGMGEVYLAHRTDGGFEQKVALKLVRAGLAIEPVIERFQSERQILARLQHPNIASLVDGGLNETGQPWFAMEYVDGVPLNRHADRNQLTIDERLRLFLQVCSAVAYAHNNLVVHRDLKPSNILVTSEGQVKLLDFGIARVLSESGNALLTHTGSGVMTPAYASPEQARGESVTLASDVYSIGVVLYELLTGLRPYEITSSNPVQAASVIGSAQPTRPSSSTTDDQDSTTSRTLARSTDLASLQRRLKGDLDVICLKTLRKEPERRYASIAALAEDVERHLSGRPILARSESTVYKVSKFVSRNWLPVSVAAAALFAVLTTLYVYTARIADARDEADSVVSFLTDVISSAQTNRLGPKVTVLESVKQAASTIAETQKDRPALRSRLDLIAGRTLNFAAARDEALPLLLTSLDIREELFGRSHELSRESRVELVSLFANAFRWDSVDSLLAIESELSPTTPDELTLEALMLTARSSWRQGRPEAESQYREAVQLAVDLGDRKLGPRRELAGLLMDKDEFEESISLLNAVLEDHAEDGTYSPIITNYVRSELALAYDYMGEDSLAIVTYEAALRSLLDFGGPNTSEAIFTRSNLALIYSRVGRHAEAQVESKAALDGKIRNFAKTSTSIIIGYAYYASVLGPTDLEHAREWYDKALVEGAKSWPEGHWRLGEFNELFAKNLRSHGLHEEAIGAALTSWKEYERKPEPSPAKPTEMAELIAELYAEVGNEAETQRWRQVAIDRAP